MEALSNDFEVFFPVKKDKEIIFTNDKNEIKNFNWGLSHIPPKQFFLPYYEELLHYQEDNIITPSIKNNPKIIFGVHPYDVRAITLLDKIFSGKYPDFYYQRRRKNFYIIGMGDYEFKNLFEPDIFLNSNGDTYEIHLKNKKAAFLLNYNGIFVKSVFEKEEKFYKEDPLFENIEKLSIAVEKSYSSKIWDELAKIDLSCGICSYVCPLCYCFDIENKINIDDNYQAKKCRSCTSCYNSDFFETSDHNFKSELRDRIYNWYYHKFVRMPREIGHVGCIDCGRCIKYCPAKINFKNVLKSIM